MCATTGALIPIGLIVGNIGFETMIGLVGGGWVVRSIIAKKNPLNKILKHPMVVPWIALLMIIAISLFVNGPGSKGWAHDLVFFRYLLFFLALLDISDRLPVTRYLVIGLAAGVFWAVINTLSAHLIGFDFLGKPLVRYTAKLKEASRISGLSAYAFPYLFSWGILDRSLSRKIRVIVTIIGIVAFGLLLQTQVRTAILAASGGVLFTMAYYMRKRVSAKVAVCLAILFSIVVIIFFSWGKMWRLDSFYDRIYYWKVTWTIWKEHPIFGVGISSYQDVYKTVAESGVVTPFVSPDGQVFKLSETTHAHNLIMMILSCTGALGLVSFAWLFINAVRLVFRYPTGYRIGLISWPLIFLTIGLTGFNIFHSWYQALFSFLFVLIACKETEGFDVR